MHFFHHGSNIGFEVSSYLFVLALALGVFEVVSWITNNMSLIHSIYLNLKVRRYLRSKTPSYLTLKSNIITTSRESKNRFRIYVELRIPKHLLNDVFTIDFTNDYVLVDRFGHVITESITNKGINFISKNIDMYKVKSIEREKRLKKLGI